MIKRTTLLFLISFVCLGCAWKRDRQATPKLISPSRTLVTAQLVDLGREDWLVYETKNPAKLAAILDLLLEAELVEEDVANQQSFDVQLRLSYADDTNSIFRYGQTSGDLRLHSIKLKRSFRLRNPERLNALMSSEQE